jgi:putative addiction module killer protein
VRGSPSGSTVWPKAISATPSLGDGVSELRFDFGPGYRIYYTMRGDVVVILLCGGDKASQARDIARAKIMAREV